jgi:hypothetical protein
MRNLIRTFALGVTIGILSALLIGSIAVRSAGAHDDGQFAADPAMHAWFDHLASGKGMCCSFADGVSIQDVDWDTDCVPQNASVGAVVCRYRVRLDGQWIEVPDAAVVTEPNKFGPAVVWPYKDYQGVTQIRCFMPGGGA